MSTVLAVDIFLQNLHNCLHVHLEYCLRAYSLHPLIIATDLFMHYASKCPIILLNNVASCMLFSKLCQHIRFMPNCSCHLIELCMKIVKFI